MENIIFISLIGLIFLVNQIFIKKNILPSFSGDQHQKLASKKSIPLSGGIFLLIGFYLFFFEILFNYYFFILLIFSIGLFSDLKILQSAKFRLILQSIIIFTFVYTFNLQITDTRIEIVDKFLSYQILSYFFVSFCILIIVNGSNFLDGLNTLTLGYYLIVSYLLYEMKLYSFVGLNPEVFLIWIFFLTIIYVFNFFNFLYLGDNGAYLLGFIYSFLLISIYNNYSLISPYFIILLLWYPGFENLFSIIRKKLLKKNSPLLPDPKHLHQLMFIFFNNKLIKNKFYANLAVANIINGYNILIFMFALENISDTKFQLTLISLNIIIYIFIYSILFKILKN